MKRLTKIIVLVSTFFVSSSMAAMDTVTLSITQANLDILKSHPFTNQDVFTKFTAGGIVYDSSRTHFRGAYTLLNLIRDTFPQWNYKVKTPPRTSYRGFREWNYNYEKEVNQRFMYDIFARAGVPAVSARHIIFRQKTDNIINYASVYLEYSDPDNKPWLTTTFGTDSGDLYKCGYDIPDSVRHVADLIILGENDSDYYLHYQKKTNNDTLNSRNLDYHTIREFINSLNTVPNENFEAWLKANFEVEKFIKYLVITNFAASWDAYPNRGKNFWLYLNPVNNKWNFIPWDVDATFGATKDYFNNIGTTGKISYMFGNPDWYGSNNAYIHSPTHDDSTMFDPIGEVHDRPLFRRMMENVNLRAAYVTEYRNAMNTYLKNSTLDLLLDSLGGLLIPSSTYNNSITTVKSFLDARTTNIAKQLSVNEPIAVLTPYASVQSTQHLEFAYGNNLISYENKSNKSLQLTIYDVAGRIQFSTKVQAMQRGTINRSSLIRGILLYRTMRSDGVAVYGKLPMALR